MDAAGQTNGSSVPVTAKGARGALVLLLTINLFNYIDRYILAAVEPAIRGDRRIFPQGAGEAAAGASARDLMMVAMAKTGLLSTAFLVSYMVTAPLFGWLADRMNRWTMVGLAVGIWSLASGASGLAPTFAALLITRCFVGIGEAGYGPSAPAMISELYPVERRGAVLAWFYMAIPVGSALGYVFGGLVGGSLGWRWPFFLVVPPGVVLAALCFYRGRNAAGAGQTVAVRVREKKHRAGVKDYLKVLKVRSYVLDTAGMAAMTFAIGGFSFWMPAYLVDQAHVGAGGSGSVEHALVRVNFIFGVIMVICGVTATLLGGWLGDYCRRYMSGSYFVISALGILASAVFIVLMMHTAFPGAWGWLFFAVFFLFLNTGPSNAILANVTRPAVRAQAFAMNILIIHALGDAISPPILGAIAGKYGWNRALYLVAWVMVLAAALWAWGAVYLRRDTESAEKTAAVAEG
jgi:MFS transporter, Spinster family, sphingosine-1-phosphate transporter